MSHIGSRIDIVIDELVVPGLAVDRDALGAAFRAELARLIETGPVSGGDASTLTVDTGIGVDLLGPPAAAGATLARLVHRSLRR